MKKNGFTLSELIITLSIIGVASALMMPAITKAMPDKNKTKNGNDKTLLLDESSLDDVEIESDDDESLSYYSDDDNHNKKRKKKKVKHHHNLQKICNQLFIVK